MAELEQFSGSTQLTLDAKGRLVWPTRYRQWLDGTDDPRLVLTADSPSCLLIYPASRWQPIVDKLMSLSGLDPAVRNLQRFMVGQAEHIRADSAGRVLVSPELRQLAGLDRQLRLVGLGWRFELWDEQRWQQQVIAKAPDFTTSSLPQGLDSVVL